MPTSKHRRKGKLRPRGKVNNAIPPRPIIDPEYPWRQDALLIAQLQKMFGGNAWTDEQIDAALDEIDREEDAIFLAMAKQRAAPTPQQLELFPVNSLAETSR
jgi:hypothetical protein